MIPHTTRNKPHPQANPEPPKQPTPEQIPKPIIQTPQTLLTNKLSS